MRRRSPSLIIIGGKEDRSGEKIILAEVARRLGRGKLVVATVASESSEVLFAEYRKAFRDLGVKTIGHLPIDERKEANEQQRIDELEGATGVFFTGGDQRRITS